MNKMLLQTTDLLKLEIGRIASKNPGKPVMVLDVGGGIGGVWCQLDTEGWLRRNSVQLEVIVFDAIQPLDPVKSGNLALSWRRGIAPDDLELVASDSMDLVTALDVIEHLPKHDGYLFLYHLDRISKTSFIRTPTGFLWQPPFRGNPYQAHISSWTPKELKSLGWSRQFGEGGPRLLIGIGTVPKWVYSESRFRANFRLLERFAIYMGRVLTPLIPSWSVEFVAIKRIKNFDLESHSMQSGSESI